VKNFFLFLILLVTGVSVFLVVRYYKENRDVSKILDQERYSRMVAEEELQKGEYRINKLEADLQTTQVKLSKLQENLDKERETKAELKAKLDSLSSTRESLEKNLQDALNKQAALEALGKAEDKKAPTETPNDQGQAPVSTPPAQP
jgi:chromosome segregation ATPase